MGSLRELRDQRRRRRGTPGRDRARVRPADVAADRRPAGDVPDPALPRWASAVAALAVVRLGPGHQHGDHLPGDPVRPGTVRESAFPNVVNPLGSEALRPVLAVATGAIIMLPIGVIGSLREPRPAVPPVHGDRTAPAAVARDRGGHGGDPLRLRARLLVQLSAWGRPTPGWVAVIQSLAIVSFGLIPIAIGVSVLRYHLFDIDLVINRALLLAAMVVFITIVYVGIVVGIGALVGRPVDPVLSAVAAAIVALAFQPARRRAQRFADRLVYGKRATPYEVLSAVLRSARERVRERGAACRGWPGAGRGHGRVPRRRVGPRRRRAPRPEAVWPPDADPARTARRLGEHRGTSPVVDARARPPPGRAPRGAVDREEAGRVDHRDRGEARPRSGRPGGAGDAQRRARGAADGHDRRAPRVAPAPGDRAGRSAPEARTQPARRRAAADRRAHREAAAARPADGS